jgi:hypothetical protein
LANMSRMTSTSSTGIHRWRGTRCAPPRIRPGPKQ